MHVKMLPLAYKIYTHNKNKLDWEALLLVLILFQLVSMSVHHFGVQMAVYNKR